MRKRLASFFVLLTLLLFSRVTFAQTYGTPGYSPGAWKPEDLATRPATPAKPFSPHDLSGMWSHPTRPGYFERHSLNDKWLDIKDKSVPDQMKSQTYPPPMTPWGKAKFEATRPSYGPRSVSPGLGNDEVSTCEPMGYPRDLWEANLRPFEIIQTSDRILQHMQYHDVWRTIWTDGRKLPKNPDPAWYGYSIGRWEGDTFVVESTGYDDRTWLDHLGYPRSDKMRMQERYRRISAGTMELDVTITDPKIYTKPWVAGKHSYTLVPKEQLTFEGWGGFLEGICAPTDEQDFNSRVRNPAGGK